MQAHARFLSAALAFGVFHRLGKTNLSENEVSADLG